MVDYHIHPDFSHDAKGSVEDCCRRALEVGLEEICFTTHFEPDPVRRSSEWVVVEGRKVSPVSDWPVAYFAAVARARAAFPSLSILAGVEVGFGPELEPAIRRFLGQYRFDFVLGAVHCVDHVAFTAGSELDAAVANFGPDRQGFCRRYHANLRAAASSGLFDALAHLDIYRKYLGKAFGPGFLADCAAGFPETLACIAQTETGIEVNTSALRRGEDEPYPGRAILARAVAAGVRRFTVGSDAHRVLDLGTGIDRAVKLLSDLGAQPARFPRRSAV